MTACTTRSLGPRSGARRELTITGKAPELVVTRAFEVPHVGKSDDLDAAEVPHVGESITRDAVRALVTLGATTREAERAVAVARGRVGPQAELEAVVRAALRECAW